MHSVLLYKADSVQYMMYISYIPFLFYSLNSGLFKNTIHSISTN